MGSNGGLATARSAKVRAGIIFALLTAALAASTSSGTSGPIRVEGRQALSRPTLPPQGLYTSCEIDTAISTCEAQDAQMAAAGFKVEVNYLSLKAHKTGSNSLRSWLAYDALIGMKQIFSVKVALEDDDPLTGTSLVTHYGTLATDCGATNNQQVIDCVAGVAGKSAGFYGWYVYDEPGCPNQKIGYCVGSLAGLNYQSVSTLAAYIATQDSHPIIGIQTPGGYTGSQKQMDKLYSCDREAACKGVYPWITDAGTPYTGFDYYPVKQGDPTAGIADIALIPPLIQRTIAANYGAEKMAFVVQAFSWYQEGGHGCSSISVCPFPTRAQMKEMRDNALLAAWKAGNQLFMVLYYYYPDVVCLNDYTGCNAAANFKSLVGAAFSPFPQVNQLEGREPALPTEAAMGG